MGRLFIRLPTTLFVNRLVSLVALLPLSLTVLGIVRILSLLGFLVLMTVLILLLVLLVLGFVHGETSFQLGRQFWRGNITERLPPIRSGVMEEGQWARRTHCPHDQR